MTLEAMYQEQAHPEHHRAHAAVARAIKSGRLVRPEFCERCDTTGTMIEASHDDYSKPLEVEWLCAPCHRRKDNANEL